MAKTDNLCEIDIKEPGFKHSLESFIEVRNRIFASAKEVKTNSFEDVLNSGADCDSIPLDIEIIPLLKKLNELPFVYTYSSCSGHFYSREEDAIVNPHMRDDIKFILENLPENEGVYENGSIALEFMFDKKSLDFIEDLKDLILKTDSNFTLSNFIVFARKPQEYRIIEFRGTPVIVIAKNEGKLEQGEIDISNPIVFSFGNVPETYDRYFEINESFTFEGKEYLNVKRYDIFDLDAGKKMLELNKTVMDKVHNIALKYL